MSRKYKTQFLKSDNQIPVLPKTYRARRLTSTNLNADQTYDLYHQYWNEWINSPICFIDKEDISIVKAWYGCENVTTIALQRGITSTTVRMRLKSAFNRMYRNRHFVQDWMDCRSAEEQIHFLRTAGINVLGFVSEKLRRILNSIGDNLYEIAIHKGPEIYDCRGVGNKTKAEIKTVFERVGLWDDFQNCTKKKMQPYRTLDD
ncbi:MAG: hypothetical protein ACRCYO_14015 [Bacteroidia bacterium]